MIPEKAGLAMIFGGAALSLLAFPMMSFGLTPWALYVYITGMAVLLVPVVLGNKTARERQERWDTFLDGYHERYG